MRERATRGPDDRLFRFCTAWLAGMALGVSAAGALLALFPSSAPVQRLVNDFVDPLFFGEGADLALFGPYREWVFAVLGASLTGWGGLMAFVVLIPFREGRPWAWRALSSTLILWYGLDTLLSLAHGVAYNALLNTALAAGFAVPLAASRRSFVGSSQAGNPRRTATTSPHS